MVILDNTPLAGWHRLLGELQNQSKIYLPETLESYLAFTLLRFSEDLSLVRSVIALEFLTAIENKDPHSLREVGDKCLLLRGLYPERAQARRLSPEYFAFVGQSAYLTIAQDMTHALSSLYSELAEEFHRLITLLTHLRHTEKTAYDLGKISHPLH